MTKESKRYVVSVSLLIICIMLILVFAHHRNRTRNFEQIDQYINELSKNTAKHVSDVFADKLDSIESVAYLYGKSIKSTDADPQLLEALELKSGFDKIRFVASDGTDYTSDGSTTNVKDREYFMRGMKGNYGICEVLESRINGEKLIGFYAPVYFHDKICGITVGFLQESTVSEILATKLYGYPADTYIFNREGVVLGQYKGKGTFTLSNIGEAAEYIDEEYREAVTDAIELHQRCKFTYTGSADRSVGYVIPVTDTTWSLAQIFPSEATYRIMRTTHKDSIKVFLQTVLVFAVFVLYLIIVYRKNQEVRSEEFAYNKVSLLMRSVSDDYLFLVDVDLETQQEIKYMLDSRIVLKGMSYGSNDDYSSSIREYAELNVAEYDRQRFIEATRLPALREVLAQQKDFYIEYDAVVQGEIRQFQGKFTISQHEQFENHMLISIRDITESTKERNAKEKELSEARRMAESSNKAKTTFLFNMSHDIRTPINAITGYTGLLEKHMNEKDKVKSYIEKIRYSSDFLLDLINNVLEMARIESGKAVISEIPYNIQELDDTIAAVFEEQIEHKHITLTKKANITHMDVFCDPLKIKQIYLNILSNALKYTPEGGSITMTLEELPYEKEGCGLYRCIVTDTGIGMSEEFLSHIFDEFEREHSATESKTSGSGLGMTIVKKLVELMNGTIEVQSCLGKGTSVTIEIPHRFAEPTHEEEEIGSRCSDTDMLFDNKRILLAEDNDMNAEIAQEILSEAGFSSEWAKDGHIAKPVDVPKLMETLARLLKPQE